MDFDVEMMDQDDVVVAQDVAPIPEAYTHDLVTGEAADGQEPGEVEDEPDQKAIVPHKVHIRGLDTFNPDDVKAYLGEHDSNGSFERVEWVDDTSANLVFKSDTSAQEALIALANIAIGDATQLPPLENIPAKPYAAKPDSVLQIRFAVVGDKKVQGAAARSRFYLLHPEYDPEERRRRGEFDKRRYRDRDGDYDRDSRRRRAKRYDYDDEEKSFDVSLYDDDAGSLARRINRNTRSRRDSPVSTVSSESDKLRSQADKNRDKELFGKNRDKELFDRNRDKELFDRNRDKELFPDRRGRRGYSRDRSASPMRDRADDAMALDDTSRQTIAMRNREKARAIKERLSRENRDNATKELFPDGRDNGPKELFPSKMTSSTGGTAQMDRVDDSTILESAKIADRLTSRDTGSTFNIRGMANRRGTDQGISIRGTAAGTKKLFPTSTKELFPNHSGNAGKELFSGRLQDRGRPRQRAEDFY